MFGIASRRHRGELDDTDPLLEDPRSRWIRRTAAFGGGAVLALLVAVVVILLPRNFLRDLFSSADQQGPSLERPLAPDELPTVESARAVLSDTEAVWSQRIGSYISPRLMVAEAGGVESACGSSSNAGGPFYCPADRRIYLDVSFLDELGERFAAHADFAEAYVVAHAVGHHIQTLSGLYERVEAQRAVSGDMERNQLTMRQELQADCYAGAWAHHSKLRSRIAPADIEAGLNAAAIVGSERAERGGLVVPETFAHATAPQRSQWFRRGFDSGNTDDCNTFEALRL